MKTQIIAGYPGIGKTYMIKAFSSVIDLESSDYHWIYDNSVDFFDYERRKGNANRKLNPNWPSNYITAICEAYEKNEFSYILIAGKLEVVELLSNCHVLFTIVVPNKGLKEEYKERYLKRNNTNQFISFVLPRWDNYMEQISHYSNVFYLNSGEYLYDVIPFISEKEEGVVCGRCKSRNKNT